MVEEIMVAIVSGLAGGVAGGVVGARIFVGRRARQSADGGRRVQQSAGDNSPNVGRDFRPR
jgi:hypothetical protein